MIKTRLILSLLCLLVGPAVAHAESERCGGTDLVATMAKDDPGLLAKMRKSAAEIENGEGLLWSVRTPEGAHSYLFGTMHLSDPRVGVASIGPTRHEMPASASLSATRHPSETPENTTLDNPRSWTQSMAARMSFSAST